MASSASLEDDTTMADIDEDDDTNPAHAPTASHPISPSRATTAANSHNLTEELASTLTTASINNSTLEVDSVVPSSAASDTDSAFNDTPPSTQSARSSVYEFVEHDGRTFHKYKAGKYMLPNDVVEQDRLDLQHALFAVLLNQKLFLAPLGENPQNILDIGTGTGIWAIEMANLYPSARVIGSDLSPIQPDFVPPNCQFEVDDAEDDWMYTQQFDFIHMRALATCFAEPRSIMEKAFNQLQPGGYLEMQDGNFPLRCRDGTLEGTALDTWCKECVKGGVKLGRQWTNTQYYRRWMEELGFEDVHEKVFEVATSSWPRGVKQKELAHWCQADLLEGLTSTVSLFTRVLGYSREQVEILHMDARIDVKNKHVHAFMPV